MRLEWDQPCTLRGIAIMASWVVFGIFTGFMWFGLYRLIAYVLGLD